MTIWQIEVDTNERLELAYEEWQTDIPTLFNTILHFENDGTILLEREEKEEVGETARDIKASNAKKRKRDVSISELDELSGGHTSKHSKQSTATLEDTSTGDLSESSVIHNASSPAPKDKRRLVVEHVRAQGLGTQKQKLALGYLSNMSAEAIDDLYMSIFNGLGMDRHKITHAIIDIWRALGKAEMSVVEDTLALPTSVQITADVGGDGDFEVKIKLPRIEGLALISKYTWPIHADAVFPSL
ncbi:hypothetical protein KNSL1_013641 [Colletotrichum chrysophilum]|nr:hypothetical protein KNSL1_013641 [Colletotrichum chrysophilum]